MSRPQPPHERGIRLTAWLLTLALFAPAEAFSRFSFCKENVRGPYETQCVTLSPEAAGDVRFKRRNADPIDVRIKLSAAAATRFISLLDATRYIEDGANYESGKKVADLGEKRLTIEMTGGTREAKFNYSTRREVTELVAFFEGLINQEMIGFDFDNALQFERLSIPKRLDVLENELKSNRIADPARLIPLLERIASDQRVVNFARQRAGKIKEHIASGKK